MIGSFLMKKYITISLLLFVPFMSMAADHCTNQSEYTIDRRCYVTDEQKQQQPYKSVVGIYGSGYINCTGTIARWNYLHGFARNDSADFKVPRLDNSQYLARKDLSDSDSSLYLFTAKHCTDVDGDGISDKTLHIKLQNGDKFDVTLVKTGDYDITNDSNFYGDWAVYRFPDNSFQESTDPVIQNIARYTGDTGSTTIPWVYADTDAITRDGRPIDLIGYGCLKIMSDNEIEEYRQKYVRALEKAGITDRSYLNTGLTNDGGIDLSKKAVPILQTYRSYKEVFGDEQLKVSRCFFRNSNNLCQGWSGNSGGPMIDRSDRLVSILTRGDVNIGGADHAKMAGYVQDFDKDTNSTGGDGDIPLGRVYQLMNK
jgi:hypothetical protein